MYINPVCNATNLYLSFLLFFYISIPSVMQQIFICNFNALQAVWQFRQIQTPEDGHIGPKHIVLSESEGEK
jgi:hypothetical protein